MYHTIPLKDGAEPVFSPMYRYSPIELQHMKKQLAELVAKKLIEPSSSGWASPVIFVQKPDGSLRFCVDYRKVNAVTRKCKYPLPRIDELLDQLQGKSCLTSLDLASGYWQVRIADEDVEKTAFRTPYGLYHFRVLSMGLTNSPATFQAVVNDLFRDLIGKTVLIYLDDILIVSNNEEEHERDLREVLERLRRAKFYVKLKKCEFFQEEVAFLGHVVGKNGIKVDPKKVEAVRDWPTPKDVHQVRQLLGFSNYFRKFLAGYAHHVAPLNALLKKDVQWCWSDAAARAFEWIKHALTHAPVLALADFSKPFEVRTDASGFATGGVLLQEGKPVAYCSKKLSPAERNYSTGEQELLAVIHALTEWRCYLEGGEHPVKVVTDHQPLTYLPTKGHLSRRQTRWCEYLSRFDIQWEHKPGRVNVADPLSRKPSLLLALTTRSQAKGGCRSSKPKDSGAAKAQEDEFLRAVREGYRKDRWLKRQSNRKLLTKQLGLWWYGTDHRVLYVPETGDLRQQCLQLVHDHPLFAHGGIKKTVEHVARLYWWPGWRAQVEEYVSHCDSCQRNKGLHQKPAGLLQPLPIPGMPWESVSMDFITHLPETPSGNSALYVVVDRLSKMVHLMPMSDSASAEDVAQLYIDNVVRLHGCPREFISDRDSRFTGRFWKAFCEGLGIQGKMSTAFHPQTDGNTEKVNAVLQDMLRHYVSPAQNSWDTHLSAVEFAINNSYHESIQTTPFRLLYGQNPLTPPSLRIPKVDNPRALKLTQTLSERVKRAKECLLAAQQRQKANADKKRRDVQLEEGQSVLLSTKNIRYRGPGTRKMMPKWIGPYTIAKRIGAVAYKLRLPDNLRIHDVFHVSLLKPYRSDGTVKPPPAELLPPEADEFEVEMLLGHRDKKVKKKNFREYLVQWTGYEPEHNTWEPESELRRKCQTLIDDYWRLRQGQQKAGQKRAEAEDPRVSENGAKRIRK